MLPLSQLGTEDACSAGGGSNGNTVARSARTHVNSLIVSSVGCELHGWGVMRSVGGHWPTAPTPHVCPGAHLGVRQSFSACVAANGCVSAVLMCGLTVVH